MDRAITYGRTFKPKSSDWRSFIWSTGKFDTGRRKHTKFAEGIINIPDHLVMVTLDGGADRLEIKSDCGHRYMGRDYIGAVSLIPANCSRHLRMLDVNCEWASISLNPQIFDHLADNEEKPSLKFSFSAFTNIKDDFISGLVGEFARLYKTDQTLDPIYCETMTYALANYVARKYGQQNALPSKRKNWKLLPWQMHRLNEYIDAHLATELRIADLAAEIGISVGHFHRSFQKTTGTTPLQFINHKRIEKASVLLMTDNFSIAETARLVGFINSSHFTRVFRKINGRTPSEFITK